MELGVKCRVLEMCMQQRNALHASYRIHQHSVNKSASSSRLESRAPQAFPERSSL